MKQIEAHRKWLLERMKFAVKKHNEHESKQHRRSAGIWYGRWQAYQDALNHTDPVNYRGIGDETD